MFGWMVGWVLGGFFIARDTPIEYFDKKKSEKEN
jgi:hypothetical protein